MKFIIPQNFNFKNKLFGLMDYGTAILNAVWAVIIIAISFLFPFTINYKIGFFIILYFPLLIFSVFGFNNENILYVFSYINSFLKNKGVYFYGKDS